jgi:hypothetical protein
VPTDTPDLGVELDEDEIKKHIHTKVKSYFAPISEWNKKCSHDSLWS